MLKNKAVQKCQHGFLIIEIIIAVLILSIALVAIVRVFPKPLQLSSISLRRSAAANLAQQAVETLKASDAAFWNSIDEKTDIDFSEHSHIMTVKQSVNQIEYTIQGTVQPHTSLLNGIVVATITVSYIEDGKIQSQKYVTYFTKAAY
jgi:Tfp pilus assembly protein PilV